MSNLFREMRILTVCGVALLAGGLAAASEADAEKPKKPKVGVSFGVTGLQVKVTGSVSKGSLKGALPRRRWKANLEQQVGKRWVARRSVKVTGPKKGPSKFRLNWKAPKALNAKVRVRVTSGKKTVGTSKVKLLSFTSGGGGGAPEVEAVETSEVQKLPTENDKTLILNGTHSYKPGDFIAAPPGEGAPNGFLLKVVSSTAANGKTTVSVKPGDLFEAVPEGQLALAAGSLETATPLNADARKLTRSMRRSSSSYSTVPVDKQVACSGSGATFKIEGSFDHDIGPNFDLKWKKTLGVAHGIEKASATVDAYLNADRSLEVTAAASCSLTPVTLISPQFRFAVPVGPVVVPITVTIPIVLDASASVSGTAKISASASISGSLGLKYEDDGLSPVKEFNADANLEHEVEAQATAEAKIGPELQIEAGWDFPVIGGIAAEAEIDLKTGLRLTYDNASNPPGKLCVPFSITGSFKLNTPIKDFNLGLPTYNTDLKCVDFGDPISTIHNKWRGWAAISTLDPQVAGYNYRNYKRTIWTDTDRSSMEALYDAHLSMSSSMSTGGDCPEIFESANSITDEVGALSPQTSTMGEGVRGQYLSVFFATGGEDIPSVVASGSTGCQSWSGSGEPYHGFAHNYVYFNAGDEWTADDYWNPPMVVSGSSTFSNWGFDTQMMSLCMSRSTVDTDSDGFPDDVDLAPNQAGPRSGLGHPAGPSVFNQPMPARFGGPDGVQGLPDCPAG